MKNRKICLALLLALGLGAWTLPSFLAADDILSGVARTVEDIGGQIAGNQASRNNRRLEQRMLEEQARNGQANQGNVTVLSPADSQNGSALQIFTQQGVNRTPTVTPLAIPHVGIR